MVLVLLDNVVFVCLVWLIDIILYFIDMLFVLFDISVYINCLFFVWFNKESSVLFLFIGYGVKVLFRDCVISVLNY